MMTDEIRAADIKAIAIELGPVEFVRLLQMCETGTGDYSVDRHEWVDRMSSEEIDRGIQEMLSLQEQ